MKTEKTRYFIVFYTFVGNNQSGVGNITIARNSFLNKSELYDDISKLLKSEQGDAIYNIVISNFIELNKEDFEYYNKTF